MTRRAFTIIELLVVITLIVLLIALLLPTLGRAREQGVTMQCSSNLHHVSMALNASANDAKDRYPAYWDNPTQNPLGPPYHWQSTLGTKYLNEPRLGYDDVDTVLRSPLHCTGDRAVFALWGRPVRSIAINGTWYPGFPPDGAHGITHRKRQTIRRQSEIVLAGDGASGAAIGLGMSEWGSAARYYDIGGATPAFAFIRHQGNLNMTFADGHGSIVDGQWLTANLFSLYYGPFFDWDADD